MKKECEQYASLMLYRLLFLYFLQSQGFLGTGTEEDGGDRHYLHHRLKFLQEKFSHDPSFSFYHIFLKRLFHEGLSQRIHQPELTDLLGQVPYLNMSLFKPYSLEQSHLALAIPDYAFERIFTFLDAFQWYLDDRPLHSGTEINLQILGRVFEKAINERQMGAYYTKEDITEYIGRTTILPSLISQAEKLCPRTFRRAEGAFWSLLRTRPDDYLYKTLKQGCEVPLPAAIEAGIEQVERREEWNKLAFKPHALAGETWREVVARRQHHARVKANLKTKVAPTVNDLITWNLNLPRLLYDALACCNQADELAAFYRILSDITILDPTCGSGAFLFAALNLLAPLYQVCLERMRFLVATCEELDGPEKAFFLEGHPEIQLFRDILAQVARHPREKYFVYKSILMRNLYGVDLMAEAVESCKLRLLLKLISQVNVREEIEPLPDLDLSILTGNALIGLATSEEIRRSNAEHSEAFQQETRSIADNLSCFCDSQLRGDTTDSDQTILKAHLQARMAKLRAKLDRSLAAEYGITWSSPSTEERPWQERPDNQYGSLESTSSRQLAQWQESHQPFHWVGEFAPIMLRGGFHVIIGNPPYVEYEQVAKEYRLLRYKTLTCGNLYAFTIERCTALLANEGRFGMIVPTSASCTDGYKPLQQILLQQSALHISSYSEQRGKLFDLPHPRLCIILYQKNGSQRSVHTTTYMKLEQARRDTLFEGLEYGEVTGLLKPGIIPRYGTEIEGNIHKKLHSQQSRITDFTLNNGGFQIYYTRKLSWFVQISPFIPTILDQTNKKRAPSELKTLTFSSRANADIIFAVLNSTLFYWFVTVGSDCRNLNLREVIGLPLDLDRLSDTLREELRQLAFRLAESLQHHSEKRPMSFTKLGTLTIQCFFPARSKAIIDEIDRSLARHYGFTEKELDFLLNYDIKYRLGRKAYQ